MSDIRSFSCIPVKIPRYKIFKRLGYNSRLTEVPAGMMDEVEGLLERASDLIRLKAVCLRSGLIMHDDGEGLTISEGGAHAVSRKLCGFLSGSDELILMGITGGSEITDEIRKLQEQGRMTAAVVLDAAAGEIVDDGFNYLSGLYSRELLREGRLLTDRRFSAGYGDFDITFQKDIYRMLKLESLGIEITESCMLLPEKTVTAVYGIQKS